MKEWLKHKIFFSNKRPRWVIFLADVIICFFALILAYLLRFNFKAIPQVEVDTFPLVFSLVIGTRALSFIIARTYQGIVRYTGSRDAMRILLTLTVGMVFFLILDLGYYLATDLYPIPLSIVGIEYMAASF